MCKVGGNEKYTTLYLVDSVPIIICILVVSVGCNIKIKCGLNFQQAREGGIKLGGVL